MRNPKSPDNIQVFRGSRPRQDVFSDNSGVGCCDTAGPSSYDKLADRTRFDNALAHSNPTGANDKYFFPDGPGFSDRAQIISHINAVGVGAQISVLAVPTYGFVTGVSIHIAAEEEGLTFNLITRNGLVLPETFLQQINVAAGETGCEVTRTQAAGAYEGFGDLGTDLYREIIGRDGTGSFSLEADELILEVASMPASGLVSGTFSLIVAVSYDVIHRAEQ